MNLEHLRYFETIARLEHYGEAAKKLHVTQPSLSHAMAQLEAELGVPLFEKSGRNVRLTRYGSLFLKSVATSLGSLDSSVRILQETGQGSGLVLIGTIRNLGSTLVPGLMRDFLKIPVESNVRFQLHTDSSFSSDLLKSVEENKLDMAFTSRPGNPLMFESFAFPQSPFVVITPPDHPLAKKKRVSLEETLDYAHVYFSERSGLRAPVDNLFASISKTPQIAYETEEDFVVAGLVAAGFGIAVIPDLLILRSLNLAVIPLSSPNPSRTAYLSMKKDGWKGGAAGRFYSFCRERLETQV